MPFAQTWSEELVAEWLELEGYLVAIEIPAPSKKGKGSRRAPDVVGARIEGDKVEIVHAEVGNWPINEKQIMELVDTKFDKKVVDTVKDYFMKKLNFRGDVDYRKLLVATWLSKKREKQVVELTKEIPPTGIPAFEANLHRENSLCSQKIQERETCYPTVASLFNTPY